MSYAVSKTKPSIRLFLTVLILGLFATTDVFAQAWPQAKKGGYYQLGFQMVRADQFYEPGGNLIDIQTLSDYVVSFYGEYGVTDKITVQAYVPFVERITLNRAVGEVTGFEFFEGDAVTGIADADVGARYAFFKKGNTVASAFLRLGLPIGESIQANGLQTGDGEFNQLLGVAVGHSFWPSPAYIMADAGYNNRTEGYSDELVLKVEGGYTIGTNITLIARVRGLFSMENGQDGNLGGTGGLYGNNQQYLTYGGDVMYAFAQGYGVLFGAEGATLAENVLAAPSFRLGVFLRR